MYSENRSVKHEELLCQVMWNTFLANVALAGNGAVLYWRTTPMVSETAHFSLHTNTNVTTIYTRYLISAKKPLTRGIEYGLAVNWPAIS